MMTLWMRLFILFWDWSASESCSASNQPDLLSAEDALQPSLTELFLGGTRIPVQA
jgi:hypothetical protein